MIFVCLVVENKGNPKKAKKKKEKRGTILGKEIPFSALPQNWRELSARIKKSSRQGQFVSLKTGRTFGKPKEQLWRGSK